MNVRMFVAATFGVVLVLGTTSCMEQPPSDPNAGLQIPAVACHDGGGADAFFVGPIDTLKNTVLHSTNNGSCGGAVTKRTWVAAANEAVADAECIGLGGDGAASRPLDNGYVTVGPDTWECTGTVVSGS